MPVVADETDWTGVAPNRDPVAPLTSVTFEARLARLTATAADLLRMRAAMLAQHPEHDSGLPEDPATHR